MTTAEILKRLESAKSEAEMLALADKLGVARSFFNAGSVVNVAATGAAPKTGKSKPLIKGKTYFVQLLTKSQEPKKKKVSARPVKA